MPGFKFLPDRPRQPTSREMTMTRHAMPPHRLAHPARVGARAGLAAVAIFAAIAMTGCDKSANDIYGRVAVLDLARVETEMGRDVARAKAINELQQQIGQRLNGIQQAMQQQMDAERAKLGPVPPPEAIERLNAIGQDMDAKMRSELEHAKQVVDQANREAFGKFRAEVLPIAQRAATDRGLSIVLDKAAGVLIASPTVDITDAVLDELRHQPAPTTAPSTLGPPEGIPLPAVPKASAPESNQFVPTFAPNGQPLAPTTKPSKPEPATRPAP